MDQPLGQQCRYPESYFVVRKMAAKLNSSVPDIIGKNDLKER